MADDFSRTEGVVVGEVEVTLCRLPEQAREETSRGDCRAVGPVIRAEVSLELPPDPWPPNWAFYTAMGLQ
jgi:hypothetical protein